MSKALNLLTIARKAGRLEIGMDPVKDACHSKKAKCVVTVKDISQKSLKEIKYVCEQESIPLLALDATMDEVWSSLGKKAGILAACDSGFAKKLLSMLEPINN